MKFKVKYGQQPWLIATEIFQTNSLLLIIVFFFLLYVALLISFLNYYYYYFNICFQMQKDSVIFKDFLIGINFICL